MFILQLNNYLVKKFNWIGFYYTERVSRNIYKKNTIINKNLSLKDHLLNHKYIHIIKIVL